MKFPCRCLLVVGALITGCMLLVACEEEEEEAPTPTTTPAATVTGTPTPAAEVPGITDTEIILGAHCLLSGTQGVVYSTIPQAAEAYFNYINDTQGGVCGRKIVYRVEDNEDDAVKGLEVVRKLVEQDKVFAMVGNMGGTSHAAVWDYLNDESVPDILAQSGAHMFGADPEGHPWTVPIIPSYGIEGTFFGEYISQNLPGKKVAVLHQNIMSGIDALEGVKDGLDPDKNEIVSEQGYEITAVDISRQVTSMKNAGAEVVVFNGSPPFIAQAIENANRLGWEPDWFISYVNGGEIIFLFVSPEVLEGTISLGFVKLAVSTDDPAIARHHEIMRDYGGPNFGLTVYSQVLAELAVDILGRTCDNLTREGLMDAVESTQDWRSDLMLDGSTVSLSETDRRALDQMRMMRATVEDGKGKWEYFGPLFVFE